MNGSFHGFAYDPPLSSPKYGSSTLTIFPFGNDEYCEPSSAFPARSLSLPEFAQDFSCPSGEAPQTGAGIPD